MLQLSRKKEYKAREPEDTINFFRGLLKEKLNLSFNEEFFVGDGQFHSCRISIANSELEDLNIGTNGKGMTREYALASAYGEFMERIQNLILISNRSLFYDNSLNDCGSEFAAKVISCDLKLNCHFAPDEEIVVWSSDLRQKYSDILDESELLCGDKLFLGKEVALLPYANISSGEVTKLPQQLIMANGTASGMCAGNTQLEAIIQGLDEILERFILQWIYLENLSFPTIPEDWFCNTDILQKIKKIEQEKDIRFIIKDCSCGMGIPAIGVLILDNKALQYSFHLGVDPSLITALERCITETYQGYNEIQWHKVDWEIQNRIQEDYLLKEAECFKFRQNSSGQLPISIFKNEADFLLCSPDNTWALSDESDFVKLMAIFEKLDRNVYVRDVSFLGAPSYQIYVPGISGLRTTQMLKNSPVAFGNRALLPSRDMNDDNLRAIVAMIKYDSFYRPIRYNLDDKWQHTDKNYQLAMLLYTLGEYDNSLEYMEIFLSNHTFTEYIQEAYYHCIRNLIWSKVYGKQQLSNLVIYPYYIQLSAKNVLEKGYMNTIPCCPRCETCKIKKGCRIFNVFELVKQIEKCYIDHVPSQSQMAESLHSYISQ